MKSKNIINDIIDRILSNEWPPDTKLPTDLDLAKYYECNRHTIRGVIHTLIDRGYITHLTDKTRIVNPLPSQYILNLSSLYDLYPAKYISTEVLEFEQIKANQEISEHLNINENNKVWYVVRRRLIDEEPIQLEYSYFPLTLLPKLTKKICESSIMNYIEYEVGRNISHGLKSISPIVLTEYERELLNTNESLALTVKNHGYLKNGIEYEYSTTIHNETEIKINVRNT